VDTAVGQAGPAGREEAGNARKVAAHSLQLLEGGR